MAAPCVLACALHVIVRETNEAAWAAADALIEHVDEATIAKVQARYAQMDSEGQRRMAALHNGRRDQLEVSPNLWAGVGLVRGGAGTALVGDPHPWQARLKNNTPTWAWTALCCPVTRTWKKPTALPSWCFRCCRAGRTAPGRQDCHRRPV